MICRRSSSAIVLSALCLLLLRIAWIRQDETFASLNHRCLFVLAHPDDEAMFFAPTLFGMLDRGITPHMLYMTTGNATGKGKTRRRELEGALAQLGIPPENAVIVDSDLFPDGSSRWNIDKMADLVSDTAANFNCNCLITFDHQGVSRHPNHIDCYHSAVRITKRSPKQFVTYTLDTVQLWRKYASLVDLLFTENSVASHPMFVNANPLRVYRLMWEHNSQLLWYRYLYMLSSRYVWINTMSML